MEMLEEGTDPKDIKYVGRCPMCKSKFRAKASELSIEWDSREQGNFARASCVKCRYSNLIFYPEKQ